MLLEYECERWGQLVQPAQRRPTSRSPAPPSSVQRQRNYVYLLHTSLFRPGVNDSAARYDHNNHIVTVMLTSP
ncbi:hypothetical protein AOLI_G00014000 [Acnodon oligacanthus]